jgi:Tol biopolymer transport system component
MRNASLLLVLVASSALALAACTSTTTSNGSSSGTSGGSSGGASGGAPGSSGTPGGGAALPETSFLYVSALTPDHDALVAWDVKTNAKTVVTDLTGDGSSGWEIAGYALSPDRTRIAIASLYEPVKADNDIGYAGRRIHTLNTDGSNFTRLTPPWTTQAAGRSTFTVEVRNPSFSKDGQEIFFDYGEYWYEGTTLKGASSVWAVPAAGGALPTYVWDLPGCSMTDPSPDPATGKILVQQSVCTSSQNTGIWLYTRDGSSPPEKLVGNAQVDPSLEQASWAKDGSGFVFVGVAQRTVGGATRQVRGAFAYDVAKKQIVDLVIPTAADDAVRDVALAPDASALVYCLQTGSGSTQKLDLHLVDLGASPPTDTAITNDGKSCHPRW